MLTQLQATFGMFAQGRLTDMSSGFRSHSSSNNSDAIYYVAGLAIAISLAMAILFYIRRRSQRTINDKKLLFRELCKVHGLGRRQIKLLRRMIANKKLKDPITLFLDSNLWLIDPSAGRKLCHPMAMRQIAELRRKIFTA